MTDAELDAIEAKARVRDWPTEDDKHVLDLVTEIRRLRSEGVSLFNSGEFRLHSGDKSSFLIDCDALTTESMWAIAAELARRLQPYGPIESVPTGGDDLEVFMRRYRTPGCDRLLIVDDVLTTGASMEGQRRGRNAIGAVIFARGPCPDWVTPLFTMTEAT